MADIRSWYKFARGRLPWTDGGYEHYLARNCQLGDIDAHLESNGHHLFIEAKHWEDTDPVVSDPTHPPGISGAQLQALRSLTTPANQSVWLLYVDAPNLNPLYVITLDSDTLTDLAALSGSDERSHQLARMLGNWQASTDGRALRPAATREWLANFTRRRERSANTIADVLKALADNTATNP